jgi:membrane peptidoglycan carboxypeptidase
MVHFYQVDRGAIAIRGITPHNSYTFSAAPNYGVDLWFIGYVPRRNLVTDIWLGNDDNSRTYGGSSQPALLWGEYMESVVKDRSDFLGLLDGVGAIAL